MRYNFLFPLIFSLKNLCSFPLLFIAFQVKLKIGSKQIKLKTINPKPLMALNRLEMTPLVVIPKKMPVLGLYFQLS
jgi:hypothetical protein